MCMKSCVCGSPIPENPPKGIAVSERQSKEQPVPVEGLTKIAAKQPKYVSKNQEKGII